MKYIDLLHRWAGGLLGLLFMVIGLTGTLLLHRRLWIGLPHAGDPPRQTIADLAALMRHLSARPATGLRRITFAGEDVGLNTLIFRDGSSAYADSRGTIVAHWSSVWARPEIWLFDLHHQLLAGALGETMLGIAALVGIGFVVTGTLLWWRTRSTFEPRLLPKRLSRPAIVRHHRDLGVIAAPFLLLSFVTGALLVFHPAPAAPVPTPAVAPRPSPDGPTDWRGILSIARRLYPASDIRSVTLSDRSSGTIVVRLRQSWEWQPNGRTSLRYSARTGALQSVSDPATFPLTLRAYDVIYPLHAATIGGPVQRLVMTLPGLSLMLLGSFAMWSFWFKRPRPRPRPAPSRKGSPLG